MPISGDATSSHEFLGLLPECTSGGWQASSGYPPLFSGFRALHILFLVLGGTGLRAFRHGEEVVFHGEQCLRGGFQLLSVDSIDNLGVELVGFLPELLQEAACLFGHVDAL